MCEDIGGIRFLAFSLLALLLSGERWVTLELLIMLVGLVAPHPVDFVAVALFPDILGLQLILRPSKRTDYYSCLGVLVGLEMARIIEALERLDFIVQSFAVTSSIVPSKFKMNALLNFGRRRDTMLELTGRVKPVLPRYRINLREGFINHRAILINKPSVRVNKTIRTHIRLRGCVGGCSYSYHTTHLREF